MENRGVLTAADGPEKGVADGLAFDRRRAVGWDQQPGGSVVLLDRVVEERQIHHRHALDPKDGITQQRVVVEVDGDGTRADVPARRRLHAGREVAADQTIFFRSELVDFLSPEVGVRWLGAKHALIRAARHRCGARGVVEHAGLGLEVELHPVGGDTRAAGFEHHVPLRHTKILVVESLDEIRHELHVLAVDLHGDVARTVEERVSFTAAFGAEALGHAAIRKILRRSDRCPREEEERSGAGDSDGEAEHGCRERNGVATAFAEYHAAVLSRRSIRPRPRARRAHKPAPALRSETR